MIWIKGIQNQFGTSDELRECGREAGFLESDDYLTGVVYVGGWTGFAVDENLPDEAIKNALSDVLADKLGISAPTFGYEVDADHPDYDDKSDELEAYYEGTHPDLDDQ